MNYKFKIKYIIIFLILPYTFLSCKKKEPKIVSNGNFTVYNDQFFIYPIATDDGFIAITKKNNEYLFNKFDFDGNRILQKNINSALDFTEKLIINNNKILKTKDNCFLTAFVYTDSLKYGNLRQYVKYLKINKNGNIIFNFDKIILDDNTVHDDNHSSYVYLDTYETDDGNIVCISKKYIDDDDKISGQLQLSKYTSLGNLISNKEINFPNVWEFWNIIYFSDNEIYVSTTSNNEGFEVFSIFKYTDNTKLEKIVSANINADLSFYSLINKENFILCYKGDYVDTQLIEFNKEGDIIRQLNLKNNTNQILITSAEIVNENIYFVGLTTNDVSKFLDSKVAWGKLTNSKLEFLGELASIESSEGISLNINTDKSISILGQKKSFGKKNIFFLKTKTDGTIDTN